MREIELPFYITGLEVMANAHHVRFYIEDEPEPRLIELYVNGFEGDTATWIVTFDKSDVQDPGKLRLYESVLDVLQTISNRYEPMVGTFTVHAFLSRCITRHVLTVDDVQLLNKLLSAE